MQAGGIIEYYYTYNYPEYKIYDSHWILSDEPFTSRDADVFDITIPQGYQVDELPLPTDAEYSFASYHSKTAVSGNVIHYTRTFEIKELTVPVSQAEELKKLYRIIAADERNMVVLKPGGK